MQKDIGLDRIQRTERTMSKLNLRVAPRTVQQGTVDMLRQAIFSGVFKPGHRLVESQLCAQLGVSRPSLREALRSLAAERLIEIVPNRGPFVPMLTWEQARAIYEIRELLEVEAVGRCAERIDEDGKKELTAAMEAIEAAVLSKNDLQIVSAAAEFYDSILAHCGNPILEELHRGLLARISFLRVRSMSTEGRSKTSLKEMRALQTAICRGDVKAARKAARTHVLNAAAAARQAIEKIAKSQT